MLLNTLDTYAKPAEHAKSAAGFGLMIFATNWGYEGNWDQFCARIRKLGYDGAEAWYPTDEAARKEFLAAFQKYDLKCGFLVGGSDRDYQKHLQQFSASLEGAAALNPVYINPFDADALLDATEAHRPHRRLRRAVNLKNFARDGRTHPDSPVIVDR